MILSVNYGSIDHIKEYFESRKIKHQIIDPEVKLKTVMNENIRGIILSGGPMMYDEEIFINKVNVGFALLLDFKIPVLGICFGHQTLVEAYDGEVIALPKVVHKEEEIEIIKESPLFKGLPKKIKMYEHHRDAADEVPFNFEQIATSKSCKIEGIQHKEKPIFGVQFHPEASGQEGYKILDNFIEICS